MPALVDVAWRTSEAADQKVAQTRFGCREVIRRIHGAQNIVPGDLRIERADQPSEALFPNPRVDLLFSQIHNPTSKLK